MANPQALPDLSLPHLTAAYMDACKGKSTDHNEIGLHYFMAGWTSGRDALAARATTAAPAGFQLVPIEPTDDMFIEGMESDCLGRPSVDDETHVRSIWRAMLAASPKGPL